MLSREERLGIFRARFKGRVDVFARRWEKWNGGVAGYSPVYTDSDKEFYEPLSTDWIEKHLMGTATLGVYPLLTDNTSHFMAADFDGDHWKDSVRVFLAICKKYNIPIAVERSRSGNGAHAWCFFTVPYPAYKSRRIFLGLLTEAGCMDPLEKNDSFDRLFPNQDYLSGKGLGNLIALPLQGTSRKNGNTIFVHPENDFSAIEDQWQYLNDMPCLSAEQLDALYAHISGEKKTRIVRLQDSRRLRFVLGSSIVINRETLPLNLISFLREELNILNMGYVVKERAGLPTYGDKKFINTLEQNENSILIPRGFLKRLLEWCDEHNLAYFLSDERLAQDSFAFTSSFQLFPYQEAAVAMFKSVDQGVLVAPAGAGKTIMGLELIAQKNQPALILTHRRQIYDQWLEQIESGFGIPKRKIGQMNGLKKGPLKPVTVAMVQTLARMRDIPPVTSMFGTVLVDECHHVPSRMFRDVVAKFPARYRFGITATPSRKYNDTKLIGAYLGDIVSIINPEDVYESRSTPQVNQGMNDAVIVRDTQLAFPFGSTIRDFKLIAKVISNDAARNRFITEDVTREVRSGQKCLILTERKEHAEMLRAYLRHDFETVLFSGDLSAHQRKIALQRVKSGRFKVLIATGQILGEGADIADLDILFLAFPISFHGKLAQYIGRICREGGPKKVYDYRDPLVPYLEKLWKKRLAYYRKSGFLFATT